MTQVQSADYTDGAVFVEPRGEEMSEFHRHLSVEAVRITEAAALAAARWMGRGDEKAADQAAVTAMRSEMDHIAIRGRIVIGEGERDEAPMLYIGEEVGRRAEGDFECDIAVDPLEGTTITARGGHNALAVIAMAPRGGLLHAPDTYMRKIAVGRAAAGVIDITRSATENLYRIAAKKDMPVSDLTVCIMARPRHDALIAEVRKAGARVSLIQDGDVSAAIACAVEGAAVDVLMGTGGAPEGVLAAAALLALGGDIQGQLAFRNDEERERAKVMGLEDPDQILRLEDMAHGDVVFAATGVTDGAWLKGVRYVPGGAITTSVVMRSTSGTVRHIVANHNFVRHPRGDRGRIR